MENTAILQNSNQIRLVFTIAQKITKTLLKGYLRMWNRIKQLWNKNTPQQISLSEAEQDAILDEAEQEMQERHYAQVAILVDPLCKAERILVASAAQRLMGLSFFHRQKFAQALDCFNGLAPQTNSPTDWINVVTAATLSGQLREAQTAFGHALQSHDNGDKEGCSGLSVAMMYLLYACALRDRKEYAMAFEQVQALRSIYVKLHITDPRFYELRNLPTLLAVLDLMFDVLQQSGDISQSVQWLEEFAAGLDVNGQREVFRVIARLEEWSRQTHNSAHDLTQGQRESNCQTHAESSEPIQVSHTKAEQEKQQDRQIPLL